MSILHDLLEDGLALVVCGSVAGDRSAALRQYYAGHGNKFWRTLHVTGLTPHELKPNEFALLRTFRIGLTDLVKTQSGGDHSIQFSGELSDNLRDRIATCQPRCLCFNGKRAAQEFFATKTIRFGLQTDGIGETAVFVAPSTSGAANGTWDLSIWQTLANLVRSSG